MRELTKQEKNIITQICTNGVINNYFLLEVLKTVTSMLELNIEEKKCEDEKQKVNYF